MSKLNRQAGYTRILYRHNPEVRITMFSQKLRSVDDEELRIETDPCYEADPHGVKAG